MLLKNLTLRNIRSYGDEETRITFSRGSSLFEGDIGSGKSTILQAVEFALFGLGDVDGRHLLRYGAKEGSVALQFEVDGKEYLVYRALIRKGRGVVQGEGYIIEDGIKTDYSVSEMRLRILEILDFKEKPQPRTTSPIYRYAIFTPQEMMKSVLVQDVEKRLDTLRRAFGIEEYRSVARNVEDIVIGEWLKGDIKTLSKLIEDLEPKKHALEEEYSNKQASIMKIRRLRRQESKIDKKLGKLEVRIKKIQPKKENIIRLEGEIPALRNEILTHQDRLDELKGMENNLKKDLKSIEASEATLQTLAPKYREYIAKKKEFEQLRKTSESYTQLNTERTKLEGVMTKEENLLRETIKDLKKKVRELEGDIDKRLRSLGEERRQLIGRRKNLTKELKQKKGIERRIEKTNKALAKIEAYIKSAGSELTKKKREWSAIEKIGVGAPCPRCKQELTKQHYEKVKTDYEMEIKKLEARIGDLTKSSERLSLDLKDLEEIQKSLEQKDQVLKTVNQGLAALRQKKSDLKRDMRSLARMKTELRRKQNSLDQADFALKERRRLTQVKKRLTQLEPKQRRYEEIKKSLSEFEKVRIESEYSKNLAEANRRKKVEGELRKNARSQAKLQKTIEVKSRILGSKERRYEKGKTILGLAEKLEEQRRKFNEERGRIRESAAAEEKYLSERIKSIAELEKEVSSKEENKRTKEVYEETVRWLNEHFIPCVADIEKHMLVAINGEFNQLFQRWFNTLIEAGDISVRVDDTFTPIIEQGGYELDIDSLSGGEKSSVALAYRLALNTMVKKVCDAMRSNILILDEPTDGFSSQQLHRLRDVLKEMNCEQVIMVSHERELESFVDNIYRVHKENGLSQVVHVK